MELDARVTTAQRMRAEGCKLREIALRFDVSISTVHRWVVPGSWERARQYRRAHAEEHKAHNRRYAHEKRGICDGCGSQMGVGYSRDGLCLGCRRERRERKRGTIQHLWIAGATIRQISEAVDTTPGAIGVEMAHMRRDGWDLPFREGYPR